MIKVHQILKKLFQNKRFAKKHAIILLQIKAVNRVKKKIVRFILWLLGILVVICLGVFLAFQLSLSQALGSSTSYSR